MSDLVVETSSGPVHGLLDREVPNWRGVPYGCVERRFRPAVPVKPATRIDATRWGPISWQVPIYAGVTWDAVYPDSVEREDCLNLNIWSPGADARRRPVLVWLHPGGHVYGAGSAPGTDAWVFAARHDAVVITANYRIGPWGWLYLGGLDANFTDSANLPVRDQILLLRWVRDNISGFGGDPDNVTLFGMSSGGSDVGTLLGARDARGLFHKAALYSGYAESPGSRAEAQRRAEQFLAGAAPLAHTAGELAKVPNRGLRYIHRKLLKTVRVHYGPFVDGDVLPNPPLDTIDQGLLADVPILVSATAEEAWLYETIAEGSVDRMYASLADSDAEIELAEKIAFLTDRLFFKPAQRLLAAMHKAGGSGWWQVFDYSPTVSIIGNTPLTAGRPAHGVDMAALFIDPHGTHGTETDRAIGAEEQAALMGLARDGRPHWAPWSPAQPAPHLMKP